MFSDKKECKEVRSSHVQHSTVRLCHIYVNLVVLCHLLACHRKLLRHADDPPAAL